MNYPWSKIQRTEFATEAYVQMNENQIAGCMYHNNDHVYEMYQYLQSIDQPYDEALDWAIMFHDVVYDNKPEKEARSAALFHKLHKKYRGCDLDVQEVDRVQFLILETEKHLVTKESYLKGSSAIIKADLHALTDKVKTVTNFTKIMQESMMLYNCTVEQFASANIDFMIGLYERMQVNMEFEVDKTDQQFYNNVLNGIDLTIYMATGLEEGW